MSRRRIMDDDNYIPTGDQSGAGENLSQSQQDAIRQINHNEKGHLPSTHQVSDMNNEFVTNLGRRSRFMFPKTGTYNQVGLVQQARASYRAELNKFNTVFEGTSGLKGSPQNETGTVDSNEFFRQTGRLLV